MSTSNASACNKFNQVDRILNFKKSLVFLKLVENSCPKKDAILFCNRKICKYDTTRVIDGPKRFRVLKNSNSARGWCNEDQVEYDLGKEYQKPQIDDNEQFEQFYTNNNKKTVDGQQQQVDEMNEFMKEIDEKYNLKYSNLPELRAKVQQIRAQQEKFRDQPVQYLKYDGQRYIELYNSYKKAPKSVVGFKSMFANKNIQQKQKKNEEFYRRVQQQQPVDLQMKFIKLQSQSELMMRLSQSPQLKAGSHMKLTLLSEIGDPKKLAEEFNKSQYVFGDKVIESTTNKRSKFKSLKLIQQQSATKVSNEEDINEQISTMISKHLKTQPNATESFDINLDSIQFLQKKYQNIRAGEQRKIALTQTQSQFNTNKSYISSARKKTSG